MIHQYAAISLGVGGRIHIPENNFLATVEHDLAKLSLSFIVPVAGSEGAHRIYKPRCRLSIYLGMVDILKYIPACCGCERSSTGPQANRVEGFQDLQGL